MDTGVPAKGTLLPPLSQQAWAEDGWTYNEGELPSAQHNDPSLDGIQDCVQCTTRDLLFYNIQ